MTAQPFPTYPKVRRSFGGFNYGLYLLVKALYNQVNNLTVEDPNEQEKMEALFDKPVEEILATPEPEVEQENAEPEDPEEIELEPEEKPEHKKKGRPAKKK